MAISTGLALLGGAIAGGLLSSSAQKKAAGTAAGAQIQAAELATEEQRRQFDAVQELLKPYVEAGTSALGQQLALAGVSGPEAQRAAITALEQGPQFQALVGQGEEAILQQASATGGLRGGNVQGALAQFRPQMLASLIEQQYGRLGGLTATGQASAAGQATAAQTMGTNISNLLQQQGAASAGAALARGQATANMWGDITGTIGQIAGMSKGGVFGQGVF
jgi:hypothetical protein